MKFRLFWTILTVIFTCLFAFPFLAWQFQKPVPLNIKIIDKTVPREDYREHLGFVWVLNHRKVLYPMENRLYDAETDYYGYHPDTLTGDDKLELSDDVDMIYVADTHGVYETDGEAYSQLRYGGLTFFEWNRIMDARNEHTTLIIEFNSIQSPTEKRVRTIVEKNLSIRASGWIGCYFPDLQSGEVPVWLVQNYEEQTKQKWEFDGSGIVFVHEDGKVVVLENDDFAGTPRFEWNPHGKEHYQIESSSTYLDWFDIIMPEKELIVEAEFQISLKEGGREQLEEHQIPLRFPAVVRNEKENMYYFAGNFNNLQNEYWARWRFPFDFYYILALLNKDEQFFWNIYVPMMNQIIKETAETFHG